MAYWEFLLQKEGDRDWLPLETAHVEISEGRYRIMAHTSFCETAVEIRLSQLLSEATPPRRRTLKRQGQTSDSGLMVVIPFTHLTPGSWTVTCAAIADSSRLREYGVQLQVLAIESGVDYWDDTFEAAAEDESYAIPNSASSNTQLSSPAVAPTHPPATPPQANATGHLVSPPTGSPATAFDVATLEDLPLRLQLQHQALVAQPKSPLCLAGQVTSFSTVEGLPTESTLWYQLRDPETGVVVHQEARSHSTSSLPSRFNLPLTLPPGLTTRLLVGELSLWTASEPPQVLAIQGFSVTLNLDALLELVANRAEQSPESIFEDAPVDATTEPSPESEHGTSEDSKKVLSPLSPREIPFRLIYLPTTGLTLPPVIYRPIDKKTVGSPSLPPLAKQPSRPVTDQTVPPHRPAKPLTLPPIGNAPPPPATPTTPEPAPTPAAPGLELPSIGRSLPTAPNAVTASPPATTPPFKPDFQSRFWERLSALAEEAQKASAERKAQMEAAGVESERFVPPVELPNLQIPNFEETVNILSHEVVVYEPEPAELANAAEILEFERNLSPSVEVLQPGEPDLEDLGSVPMPSLVLPEGELVAGAALPISIRMPLYPRRLAVKVWVTDIQSRTLADRPRWLMNWTPTGDGEQTAFLQLQVPLGSLEARFEAIAIDLATQQESYKVSQVRSIVPPNLPPTVISSL